MTIDNIIDDLKKKIYHPIYVFYGEESYFIDVLTNYIQEHVLTETEKTFNQVILYGKDTNPNNLVMTARRFPMMSNLQVVILKEAQDMRNLKLLEPYIAHPLASTLLVLSFKKNLEAKDKKTKIWELLLKNSVVFESKKLYEREVYSWIQKTFKENKMTIDLDALRLFYESIGSNLTRLANEINKLKITHQQKTPITTDEIAKNIGISRDYNIFELRKAIGQKDKIKAYKIMDYLTTTPQKGSLIGYITILYKYFTNLLIINSLGDKSRSNIKLHTNILPFTIDEYLSAAGNYSRPKLLSIISYLCEADLKSKGVGTTGLSDSEISKELLYKILH